jgi:purine-binding chemotaxis protein CheW
VDEQHLRTLATTAERILLERAASLANESSEDEVTDSISLLLFRIADEWYSMRVSDVREIFQEYELTPIPCVPDHILGVVNVRGEILSVTDPAKLMRIGAIDTDQAVPPAIVIGSGEVDTALVVDEIGDITEVPADAIEPPISTIDRSQGEYIAGSVHVGDSMVGLINVEKILEPITTGVRH